jgi:predicted metal-dependent peptidase
MELEIFGKVKGESAGTLVQNIRAVTRERYDYTDFLRKFAAMGEEIRTSEDEFDYIYYTYGLTHYGNMPLIEPLEYRDKKNIRDFVIAIDTSGSVKGEIVQKFVQHTHDVLAAQNSFDTRINLYIIQCDDEIRDVEVISSADDFERYFIDKEIKGLGRTDFRPVFEYVGRLLEERKLTDLRGVLYFTDGMGKFPERAPGYDVAFIIHNDSMRDVWVPDWAMKIEMQGEEIMGL